MLDTYGDLLLDCLLEFDVNGEVRDGIDAMLADECMVGISTEWFAKSFASEAAYDTYLNARERERSEGEDEVGDYYHEDWAGEALTEAYGPDAVYRLQALGAALYHALHGTGIDMKDLGYRAYHAAAGSGAEWDAGLTRTQADRVKTIIRDMGMELV